jgi:two-component system, LytTR family, response regulator
MTSSTSLSALLIDDESKARRVVRVLLEEHFPQITICGEAENLPDGSLMIRQLRPDIVFLDVEMPTYVGTRLLEFLAPHETDFELIFTTAHSEFALKAFQLNAIDYLLKPIQEEHFLKAVVKAVQHRGQTRIAEQLTHMQQRLDTRTPRRLGLPLSEGILYLDLDEIVLIKADRMYTVVHTVQEGDVLVSKPLRYFLALLGEAEGFFQTHRSYLINLLHVRKLSMQDGGSVLMDNGQVASITKEKRDSLQVLLGR